MNSIDRLHGAFVDLLSEASKNVNISMFETWQALFGIHDHHVHDCFYILLKDLDRAEGLVLKPENTGSAQKLKTIREVKKLFLEPASLSLKMSVIVNDSNRSAMYQQILDSFSMLDSLGYSEEPIDTDKIIGEIDSLITTFNHDRETSSLIKQAVTEMLNRMKLLVKQFRYLGSSSFRGFRDDMHDRIQLLRKNKPDWLKAIVNVMQLIDNTKKYSEELNLLQMDRIQLLTDQSKFS